MRLEGRRILVTGAARGIGLAVVRQLCVEGARVVAVDRDGDELEQACDSLASDGYPVVARALDVTNRDNVREVLSLSVGNEPLDGLINNAAIMDAADAATADDERFSYVLDVNLQGALRMTQEALPYLRKASAPAVVNTLSTQAFFAVPSSAAYATAKGGLLMLTRVMAVDFGAEGIRVNGVAPGFIDTRMAQMPDGRHEHKQEDFKSHYIAGGRIPLRRAGKAEDCAGAFVFLVSEMSLYITGQVVFVDGGLSATY